MKTTFLLLSTVLASSLIMGCTGKSSQRTVHEGPKTSNDYNVPAIQPSELKSFIAEEDYSKTINEAKTAEELLSVINKLGNNLLNVRMLESHEARSLDFTKALSLFNRAIMRAFELNPDTVKSSGWLDRFQAAVTIDCEQTLKDCSKLAIFKRDHLSSTVFLTSMSNLISGLRQTRSAINSQPETEGAKDLVEKFGADLRRFYTLLPLAIELNNASPSDRINMLYIEFGADFFKYNSDSVEIEALRSHQTKLNLALTQMRDSRSSKGRDQYCAVINQINPLYMQSELKEWTTQQTIRSYVEDFFECNKEGEVIEKIVKETLSGDKASQVHQWEKDQTDELAQTSASIEKMNDYGFFYTKKEVEAWPEMMANLDIKISDTDSVAFYVINNLFYEKLDSTMIQSLWKRTKVDDDAKFFELMRNYARLQVAYASKLTISNFATLLKNEFSKAGSLGADSFEEIQKNISSPSKEHWDIVGRRLRLMKDFLVKAYDEKYTRAHLSGKSKEAQDSFNALKLELDSTVESMGLTLIKPLELAMYYYMAKAQGQLQIRLGYLPEPRTVKADTALRGLLTMPGRSYSVFSFGKDIYEMDSLQILHFFEFALRSGIFDHVPFDLYQKDQELRISTEDSSLNSEYLFFTQLFKDLFSGYQQALARETDKFNDFANDVGFWTRFNQVCQNPITASINFESNKDIFAKTLVSDKDLLRRVESIYSSINGLTAWREDRREVEKFLKILKAHFSNDAALTPQKLENRDLILSEIDKVFKTYTDQEVAFNKVVFELDKRVVNAQNNCLSRIYEADFFRKRQILLENIHYFHDVHAAMTLLTLAGDDGQNADLQALINQWADSKGGDSDALEVAKRMSNLVSKAENANLLNNETYSLKQALNDLLGVHNLETLRDRNVGYFVDGVESFETAPFKRINRNNEITAQTFQNSRWDAFARVRSLLKTSMISVENLNQLLGISSNVPLALGANVALPLRNFAVLEQDGMYTSTESNPVPYHESSAVFVQSAMKQFSGDYGGEQMFHYLTNMGTEVSLLARRRSWLSKLYSMGTFSTSVNDDINCKKDVWGRLVAAYDITGKPLPGYKQNPEKPCEVRQVTPAILIDAFLDHVRFENTSGFGNTEQIDEMPISDREILLWTQRPEKLVSNKTGHLAYRGQSGTKHWTYFEEFFRDMFFFNPGREAEEILFMDKFRLHVMSYQKKFRNSGYIFQPSEIPTYVHRQEAREEVIRNLTIAFKFQQQVEEMENQKVILPNFVIDKVDSRNSENNYIDGWRAMIVAYRPEGTSREGTPIYLKDTESVKSFFDSSLRTSIVDYDCEFLPSPLDPDVNASITGSSCRERYSQWRNQFSSEAK